MEYSKEDLMEAKRQILGVGENIGNRGKVKNLGGERTIFGDNAMG